MRVLGDLRLYSGTITDEILRDGPLRTRSAHDHERIVQKIAEAGIRLPGPISAKLQRWAYKLNIWRHIKYLIVR